MNNTQWFKPYSSSFSVFGVSIFFLWLIYIYFFFVFSPPLADIIASAVLSGNRNFEGRVHALTRANYLASPPLVVAYALAGTVCLLFIFSSYSASLH